MDRKRGNSAGSFLCLLNLAVRECSVVGPKGVAPGRQSWGRELSEDTLLLVTLLPMNIFWGLEFYL